MSLSSTSGQNAQVLLPAVSRDALLLMKPILIFFVLDMQERQYITLVIILGMQERQYITLVIILGMQERQYITLVIIACAQDGRPV
jgi:hypothetical protein